MAKPTPPMPQREESIKETFESIVIAFILAFVFRAYVVEAFVIPTGSMAPTLLGEHVRVRCAQCGYGYTLDAGGESATGSMRVDRQGRVQPYLTQDINTVCPMCKALNTMAAGTRVSAGDRILVHKYIYNFSHPRRWDVVVFKNPTDPSMNYIKRLVGLPDEDLLLVEGNLYTRPHGQADDGWRIARKTDLHANPQAMSIQRGVWQPLYHSAFVPLDVATARPAPGRAKHPWELPWKPATAGDTRWNIAQRDGYHFTPRTSPADATDEPATLVFDFASFWDYQVRLHVYNQLKPSDPAEPIEDVRLAALVEMRHPDATLTLSTTARLDDPQGLVRQLRAVVGANGEVSLLSVDPRTASVATLGGPVRVGAFSPGRTRQVELWYVDQQASVWVAGQRLIHVEFDLPMDAVQRRRSPPPRPLVTIAAAGGDLTLHRVELDRDLYYTVRQPGGGDVARAGYDKSFDPHMGQPFHVGPDQFFVMGDNSPWSFDSRFWRSLNPWVEHRHFDDQPMYGVVPRKLMMGRAFFVYWPAPWPLAPTQFAFIPNFANMRFIH